jgi:hypothetical protein
MARWTIAIKGGRCMKKWRNFNWVSEYDVAWLHVVKANSNNWDDVGGLHVKISTFSGLLQFSYYRLITPGCSLGSKLVPPTNTNFFAAIFFEWCASWKYSHQVTHIISSQMHLVEFFYDIIPKHKMHINICDPTYVFVPPPHTHTYTHTNKDNLGFISNTFGYVIV